MRKKGFIYLSGFLWFCIGTSLMFRGFKLLPNREDSSQFYQNYLVFLSLLIGFFKGRFILYRSAKRVVTRIMALPKPVRLWHVYSPAYLGLIGLMIGLSFVLRFLPNEIRSFINLAIGFSLINGSFFFFQRARVHL